MFLTCKMLCEFVHWVSVWLSFNDSIEEFQYYFRPILKLVSQPNWSIYARQYVDTITTYNLKLISIILFFYCLSHFSRINDFLGLSTKDRLSSLTSWYSGKDWGPILCESYGPLPGKIIVTFLLIYLVFLCFFLPLFSLESHQITHSQQLNTPISVIFCIFGDRSLLMTGGGLAKKGSGSWGSFDRKGEGAPKNIGSEGGRGRLLAGRVSRRPGTPLEQKMDAFGVFGRPNSGEKGKLFSIISILKYI